MKQNVKFAILGTLVVLVFFGGFALGRVAPGEKAPAPVAQSPETAQSPAPETTLPQTETAEPAPETRLPEGSTETTASPEEIITGPAILPSPEEPPFSKNVFTLRFIPRLERAGAKRIEVSIYQGEALLGIASFSNADGSDLSSQEYDFTLTRDLIGKKPVELGLSCTVIYEGEDRQDSTNRLKVVGQIGKSYPFIISAMAGEHYLAAGDFE